MQAHALPSSFPLIPCPADAFPAVHLPSSSPSVCLPAVICCLHLSISHSHWLAGWLAAAPGSPRRASLAATQLPPLNRRHSFITGGNTPPSLLHGNSPANPPHLPACLPVSVRQTGCIQSLNSNNCTQMLHLTHPDSAAGGYTHAHRYSTSLTSRTSLTSPPPPTRISASLPSSPLRPSAPSSPRCSATSRWGHWG